MYSGRSIETTLVVCDLPEEWDLTTFENILGKDVHLQRNEPRNELFLDFASLDGLLEGQVKLEELKEQFSDMKVRRFSVTAGEFLLTPESCEHFAPYFNESWQTYVNAGLAIQGETPELVSCTHELAKLTRTQPRSVQLAKKTKTEEPEGAECAGAGAEEIEEVVESKEVEEIVPEEPHISEGVKANILKIEPKKVELEVRPMKKQKKRRRKRKQRVKKVNILDFLKVEEAGEKVEEEEVEVVTKEPVRRRRRKRKKNKVLSLNTEGQLTAKVLEERRIYEEKIAVKKNFKFNTSSRAQYEGEKGVKAWSGGSGYGSSHTKDTSAWDVNTYLSQENTRVASIRDQLANITTKLDDNPLMVEFITQSCLMTVLYDYCLNDSLNDIESRPKLYAEVFECVMRMLSLTPFAALLREKRGSKSILDCVQNLANKFKKRMALEKDTEETPNELAMLVISIAEQSTLEEEVESQCSKSSEDYVAIMRDLCFESVETMESMPGHKYAKSSVNMKRKLMKRLAVEYSDLGESLPIHEESSVFFRFCDEKMTHAQMLIIACEGTPYAGGCFIFDVMFPENYPAVPPKVNLQTTGRGAVRFNPNLYNCGKVCLSLLGTWSGNSQGEMWNPKLSSFLQVAISIQSLIFVPEPYYNEPGWERYMGTKDGDRRSREYNKVRERGTVAYAIIEMLENPPAAFKDVIKNHFRLQADRVLSNVARWMGEDAPQTEKVETLLRNLKAETVSIGA